MKRIAGPLVVLAAFLSPAFAQTPGPLRDGRILLHDGWRLSPIGRAYEVGTLPMAVVPLRGQRAAVLLCGYAENGVDIVNLATGARQRVVLPKAWLGLAASSDGRTLYASGGADNVVHVLRENGSSWAEQRAIRIAPEKERCFVAGIALDEKRGRLYVAENLANRLAVVDLSSDGVTAEIPTGSDPYQVRLAEDGARAFVSNWGDSSVSDVALDLARAPRAIATGSHPTDLLVDPREPRLYVACAQDDVVTVIDTARGRAAESLATTLSPGDPEGATPTALALSPDGSRLYAADADNNDVAVLARGADGFSVAGFLPVGRYPDALALSAEGDLLVADAKGSRPFANPDGPRPTVGPSSSSPGYVLRRLDGDLRAISPGEMAPLARLTERVVSDRPTRPAAPRLHPAFSRIKHVIYVIKENRTYDQVLGDERRGNGDPRLVLFGKAVSPNHHALAEEFALLDDFYCNAEVSADGHNWSTAAFANDYVEKTYPAEYSHRGRSYDYEGARAIAYPRDGFLWDAAKKAGLSYRSYGEFVTFGLKPGEPEAATVPGLRGHVDPRYHGFDLSYRDTDRVEEWLREFREFERRGDLPALEVIRLPNDHTAATLAGARTPTAMVADNDLALGRLVDAVTRSRDFADTAIFVVEDDAQNGPDHVDCHRAPAFVISAYTPRHSVDHRMYSTASVLATIERILGLPPMSQYDERAPLMEFELSGRRDLTPYSARPSGVDLNAVNPPGAPMQKESAGLDLSREDAAPEQLLNDILYEAVQGRPAPPPVFHFGIRAASPASDDD